MLDKETFDRLISRALRYGGDFADVYCERRRVYAFRLQDGRIHEGATTLTLGVGIRVVTGESAGYAYCEDLSTEALMRAADAASLVARSAQNGTVARVDVASA